MQPHDLYRRRRGPPWLIIPDLAVRREQDVGQHLQRDNAAQTMGDQQKFRVSLRLERQYPLTQELGVFRYRRFQAVVGETIDIVELLVGKDIEERVRWRAEGRG